MPRTVTDFLWQLEAESFADSHDRFANLETNHLLNDFDPLDGTFSLPLETVDIGAASDLSLI